MVERLDVTQVVAGSSPVSHPTQRKLIKGENMDHKVALARELGVLVGNVLNSASSSNKAFALADAVCDYIKLEEQRVQEAFLGNE